MTSTAPEAITSRTDDEITDVARRILTNDLLIADLNDHDWQVSLGLILSAMKNPPNNVGFILVPMGPHAHGYWLNGRVPGCTLVCELVAEEDRDRLVAEYDRMRAALYPEKPPLKGTDGSDTSEPH